MLDRRVHSLASRTTPTSLAPAGHEVRMQLDSGTNGVKDAGGSWVGWVVSGTPGGSPSDDVWRWLTTTTPWPAADFTLHGTNDTGWTSISGKATTDFTFPATVFPTTTSSFSGADNGEQWYEIRGGGGTTLGYFAKSGSPGATKLVWYAISYPSGGLITLTSGVLTFKARTSPAPAGSYYTCSQTET